MDMAAEKGEREGLVGWEEGGEAELVEERSAEERLRLRPIVSLGFGCEWVLRVLLVCGLVWVGLGVVRVREEAGERRVSR
jgi:hypothetical protein